MKAIIRMICLNHTYHWFSPPFSLTNFLTASKSSFFSAYMACPPLLAHDSAIFRGIRFGLVPTFYVERRALHVLRLQPAGELPAVRPLDADRPTRKHGTPCAADCFLALEVVFDFGDKCKDFCLNPLEFLNVHTVPTVFGD